MPMPIDYHANQPPFLLTLSLSHHAYHPSYPLSPVSVSFEQTLSLTLKPCVMYKTVQLIWLAIRLWIDNGNCYGMAKSASILFYMYKIFPYLYLYIHHSSHIYSSFIPKSLFLNQSHGHKSSSVMQTENLSTFYNKKTMMHYQNWIYFIKKFSQKNIGFTIFFLKFWAEMAMFQCRTIFHAG